MKHLTFSNFLSLVCLLGLCVISQSCDDDVDNAIQGCTDPDSLNFDALATEDDGTCTFNSERFLGMFRGPLECPPNELIELSNDSTVLEISQGVFSTRAVSYTHLTLPTAPYV